MGPLEIISLILVAIVAIKFVFFAINPKGWMKIPEGMFKQPIVTIIIGLALGALVLYYLLQELTIVQIFASTSFFMAVTLVSFAAFPKIFTEMSKKVLKQKNIMRRAWLPFLIWIVLSIWVVYAIFA